MPRREANRTSIAPRVSFLLPAILAATLCSTGVFAAMAQRHDGDLDAWVTARAKVALLTADAGNLSRASLDTFRGRVMLAGPAPLSMDLPKLTKSLESVHGVDQVRSLLKQSDSVPAVVDDATIGNSLKEALENDSVLDDSQVTLSSVKGGKVHLTGKAASIYDHLQALHLAWDVPGVRGVTSDVQVPDALYTKAAGKAWRDAALLGKSNPGPLQDAWITSAIKLKLVSDPKISTETVGVDTRKGVVTLFGVVANAEARPAAEAHARSVSHVQGVVNDIQVDTSIEIAAAEAIDSDVAARLQKDLESYIPISGSDIEVDVKDGIATLQGRVPTDEHALAATLFARAVPGVRAVKNELKVDSHQE